VDILICTPGRLIDHLNGTQNFLLQHLRFLVIDEADRLLAQSFQNWLAQVLAATQPPAFVEAADPPKRGEDGIAPIPYPDALSPAFLHLLHGGSVIRSDIDEKRECSCQKLLFSATLMSDPGRIAALGLRTPRYIVVQSTSGGVQGPGVLGVSTERFSMPATLKVCGLSPGRENDSTKLTKWAGTYDRVRCFAKATDVFPSGSLCRGHERSGIY
jgi:ATP-dependent RNA helicase DDX51/DBP6